MTVGVCVCVFVFVCVCVYVCQATVLILNKCAALFTVWQITTFSRNCLTLIFEAIYSVYMSLFIWATCSRMPAEAESGDQTQNLSARSQASCPLHYPVPQYVNTAFNKYFSKLNDVNVDIFGCDEDYLWR